MFRGRAAGSGFKEAAAVQQGDDREHFGAGPDFKNWEQVGEVVSQHVPRHGNRIFPLFHPFQREPHRLRRRHDPDVEALRIVIRQIAIDLLISSASCARFLSNQKTAGAPVAFARLIASLTQSWMGASLTWHIRQISPSSTLCSSNVCPDAVTTRIVPLPGALKVLSCDPYSSAACAMRPTLGTLPIVLGSKAPFFLQNSTTS